MSRYPICQQPNNELIYDDNRYPHIVYDLSIKDLNERKEKAKTFDNAKQVADYLGVKTETVFRNRTVGKQITALNKKQYAVRIINK